MQETAPSAGTAKAHSTWGGLLILTALGLAARLAFLVLEPEVALAGDESSWVNIARWEVVDLRQPFSPWASPLIFYPPGYPYFVGVMLAVFGALDAVRWVQAAVGSLLVLAVGRVGSLAFSRQAGLVAAGVTALYPDLIWYSVHFWSETLFMVLLWWGFERLLASDASARWGAAVGAGLLWGLAALTRETTLHFVPVAAVWLAWSRRPRAPLRACAFLLAAAVTIAPWTYRNWVKFGAFIPISSFGPMNLWQGNTDLSREELYAQYDALPGIAERYRFAWARATQAIRERQPAWVLEKLVSEMPRFWGVDGELVHHVGVGAYGAEARSLETVARLATGIPYVALLPVFILGLATLRLRRPEILLLLFLVYCNAIHVVAYAADRYRLPVMPVIFVVAGYAWSAWRGGSLPTTGGVRRALAWVAVLVLTVLVVTGSPPPPSAAVP